MASEKSETKMEDIELKFKRLKSERSRLRRLFTTCYNKMKSILKCKDTTDDIIEIEYNKLLDRYTSLSHNEQQVSELLYFAIQDQDEIDNELDSALEYKDRWIEINTLYERMKINNNSSDESSYTRSSSVKSKNRTYKLPKLQLYKFDGNLKNWICFWAQFNKIHEDNSLDDEDKFQYLIQSTLEKSPARELVESFPPSANNYKKVIKQMKKRFGRDELLIELYVRELLKLVLDQNVNTKKLSLRSLYDKIETQVRALESLGVTADKYSCMLFPLIESALPDNILRLWERQKASITSGSDNDEKTESLSHLDDLLKHLRKEVECEERLNLARSSFQKSEGTDIKRKPNNFNEKIPTAASLVDIKNPVKLKCVFCGGHHANENCFKARTLELEVLKKSLRDNGCCFICLKRGHTHNNCKTMVSCIICNKRHQPIMCPERKKNENCEPEKTISSANFNQGQVYMQSLKVVLRNGNKKCDSRLLIDTGSQRSYITKRLVSFMKFDSLGKEQIVHALFGGICTKPQTHTRYIIHIENPNNYQSCKIEVLDVEKLCPSVPCADGPWKEELKKKGIILSDVPNSRIDILIGSDVAGQLFSGRKEVLDCGLVALETLFGWTLMGRTKNDETNYMNISLFSMDFDPNELWNLETLGIEDPGLTQTKKEKQDEAEKYFNETVSVQQDGRYQIRLPWSKDHPPISRNFELAKTRLEGTLKKLRSEQLIQSYEDVFSEWQNEGIIEEIPFSQWDEGHYLPHRPVIKNEGTTRIRPVFDASASIKGRPSLNQCLEKGTNLIELIPNILLRMRQKKIGVIADIKKAFLQILVHEEDRNFLRFLWINKDGSWKIFRHRRVVFGVSSSPFLLEAVIRHHIDRCEGLLKIQDKPYSLSTNETLRKSFYVDNCVASLKNYEDLTKFIKEATFLFSMAQFELRGWEYTDPTLQSPTDTPLLGLSWDRQNDLLRNKIPSCENVNLENVTRRTLLSITQQIFDVLGLFSPATLIPKLLIQETWVSGQDWDSEVAEEIRKRFERWLQEVHFLKQIYLPRYIEFDEENSTCSLHVFCDASQLAYATVCYLRIDYGDMVNVHFIEAKSRVAPLKKNTIPRLELLGATIAARLARNILKELGDIPVFYWTDSTTALAWIRREEPWGVFVWNRVEEIRKLSKKNCWFHVPGFLNPADIGSRGCSPLALVQSKWWEGPTWLRLPREQWPTSDVLFDEEEIIREKKKIIFNNLRVTDDDLIHSLIRYFSNYSRIIRMVAWMLRFIANKFHRTEQSNSKILIPEELRRAELTLLRLVQKESFQGIEDVKLKKLNVFVDEHGLIRLKTKIWNRKDTEAFRAPIILPSKHVLINRLIILYHQKNGHMMGQSLMNLLREKFWILRCRQTVRRVVSTCILCQRFAKKALEVESPALPENRVRDARVFEVIGIDFAGPLFLKNQTKVWVCIFTCAVYRAVHLDLVSSLSTEKFIMAFRRFIARRGRPSIVYSDNGTNFRGTYNLLQKIDWTRISDYSSQLQIEWRFNPPTGSWWGGFWERLIGVLKNILKKILGRASLEDEELYTIVCDCESYINARPITFMSDDNNDPLPITPQMFIQEIDEGGVPDFDKIDSQSLKKRIKYRHQLKQELRQRFRIEYLGQLIMSANGTEKDVDLKVGDLIFVGSDDRKRIDWPLAIVKELVKGPDQKVRVVYLKTAEGMLCRPIQRVYPLEMPPRCEDAKEESSLTKVQDVTFQQEVKKTRTGRVIKIPSRFNE